jgi:hypothetical protein
MPKNQHQQHESDDSYNEPYSILTWAWGNVQRIRAHRVSSLLRSNGLERSAKDSFTAAIPGTRRVETQETGSIGGKTRAPARQSVGDCPVQRRNARVKQLPAENPSKYVTSLTLCLGALK